MQQLLLLLLLKILDLPFQLNFYSLNISLNDKLHILLYKLDSPFAMLLDYRDAMVQPQEEVTVVGFPVGGDNMSITAGVVSRIDMQEYTHGCPELLVVQIDALGDAAPLVDAAPPLDVRPAARHLVFQDFELVVLPTQSLSQPSDGVVLGRVAP